jgi:hypothetical protein
MATITDVAYDAIEVELVGSRLDIGTVVTLRLCPPGGTDVDIPALVTGCAVRTDRKGREVRTTTIRAAVRVQVEHP